MLRPAFPDLTVVSDDQVTEDDKVTTRKKIGGSYLGQLIDILATDGAVKIDVIDMVRLRATADTSSTGNKQLFSSSGGTAASQQALNCRHSEHHPSLLIRDILRRSETLSISAQV